MKRKPKVQVYLRGRGIVWHFHIVIALVDLMPSIAYSRKANAKRAAERVCEALGATPEWM